MKKTISILVATLLLLPTIIFGAPAATDITGNWKGTLDTGSAKLRLIFKINKSATGALTATLDSVDQGARDIPVNTVTVSNNSVQMEVKTVHGSYTGELDTTGKKLTGQWTQGVPLPLTLEKIQGNNAAWEAETLSPSDLAANKQAAQKLAGNWNGTLAAGAVNLRLQVKISKTPTSAATGTLDSLDQGAKDIPLNAITFKEGKVRFESSGIGAVYEGSLSGDGTALTGQWHQGGQSLPLDFKKSS